MAWQLQKSEEYLAALLAGAVATVIGAAGILAESLWLIFSPVRRLQVPPGEQTLDPD
jgi:hypothetical protein